MNEEEFREILLNLGYKFDINKREEEFCLLCIKKGFQKGELKQKKEELEFLKDTIKDMRDEEKGFLEVDNNIVDRIKQLQKEIGEEKGK